MHIHYLLRCFLWVALLNAYKQREHRSRTRVGPAPCCLPAPEIKRSHDITPSSGSLIGRKAPQAMSSDAGSPGSGVYFPRKNPARNMSKASRPPSCRLRRVRRLAVGQSPLPRPWLSCACKALSLCLPGHPCLAPEGRAVKVHASALLLPHPGCMRGRGSHCDDRF